MALVGRPAHLVAELGGHLDAVFAVALSADERWLATASEDNTTRLWDLHQPDYSTAPRLLAGHASSVRAAAISPDGRWLATGSDDNTARLWSLVDPALPPRVLGGHRGAVSAVAFTADSRWLATGSRADRVCLWPLSAADPTVGVVALDGHRDSITALAVSPTVAGWQAPARTTPRASGTSRRRARAPRRRCSPATPTG